MEMKLKYSHILNAVEMKLKILSNLGQIYNYFKEFIVARNIISRKQPQK